MPRREAVLYDGTVLDFPDNTPDSVIQSTAKRITLEKQGKPVGGYPVTYEGPMGPDRPMPTPAAPAPSLLTRGIEAVKGLIPQTPEPLGEPERATDFNTGVTSFPGASMASPPTGRPKIDIGAQVDPFINERAEANRAALTKAIPQPPRLADMIPFGNLIRGVINPGSVTGPQMVNPLPEALTSDLGKIIESSGNIDPGLPKTIEGVMMAAPMLPPGTIGQAIQSARNLRLYGRGYGTPTPTEAEAFGRARDVSPTPPPALEFGIPQPQAQAATPPPVQPAPRPIVTRETLQRQPKTVTKPALIEDVSRGDVVGTSDVKPTLAEGATYDVPATQAELPSNVIQGIPITQEPLGEINVPSQRAMVSGVVTPIHEPKVGGGVVEPVTVDVVDNLARQEPPPDVGLDDRNVLVNPSIADPNATVSSATDTANPRERAIAGLGAEVGPVLSENRELALKDSPAVVTSNIGGSGQHAGSLEQPPSEIKAKTKTQPGKPPIDTEPAKPPDVEARIKQLESENAMLKGEKTVPRGQPGALRRLADAMEEKIQGKLNPAIANQNPTRRRASIAEGMYKEGEGMREVQKKLRAMADAIEGGTLPESLSQFSNRSDVERLRFQFRAPGVNNYSLDKILDATKGLRGSKESWGVVSRIRLRRDPNKGFTPVYGSDELDALDKLATMAQTGPEKYQANIIKEEVREARQAVRLKIDTADKFAKAKSDLETLVGPKQEIDPKAKRLRDLENKLIGTKVKGRFFTPKTLAEEVVDAADIQPGMKVLEPSAGKGDIADVIKSKAPDADLSTVELASDLREILELKGHKLIDSDFLEHKGEYDRIVMNPPFEGGQDITHVRHAYEQLKPGGRLVAIMSEGPFFRNDKAATEFRSFLDSVGGESEKLGAGRFTGKETITQTGLATRIVKIEKPREVRAEPDITMTKRAEEPQPVEPAAKKGYRGVDEIDRADLEAAPRSPFDIIKEEKGSIIFGRGDPLSDLRAEFEIGTIPMSFKRLAVRVEPTLKAMGFAGKDLAEDLKDFYYESQRRKNKAKVQVENVFKGKPEVRQNLWKQVEGLEDFTPQGQKAYDSIKDRVTDPIGDESEEMQIKVKNPITGQERAFKKLTRYFPRIIDPEKAKKYDHRRLVDKIMDELMADGVERGEARSRAHGIVRNMSRKSGNLQFMRTRPEFDPNLFITDAQEAYTRAAVQSLERIEALKRFGKTDANGLLGNELEGIREITADISQEAGDQAAQIAEKWARRVLGMPEDVDIGLQKIGQGIRNWNVMKLGFMPFTNLVAQVPLILAAGKTTQLNPVKSFQAIAQAFGERGGHETARRLGVAMLNTADDVMNRFEMHRGGPLGHTAERFLKYSGGQRSEQYVSKLAAYVAYQDANAIIEDLIANPDNRAARRAAQNYGLDPDKVVREGLTEENVFRAARKFADETLLRGHVLDMPGAYTSEAGKVFLQFKRATQMLFQMMWDAARKNPRKFFAMLLATQIGGEVLEDVKALVRGAIGSVLTDEDKIAQEFRRRPEGFKRLFANWASAASFGTLGDVLVDIAEGKDWKTIASKLTVAAAPLESAVTAAHGVGKILKDERGGGKEVLQSALREAPFGSMFLGATRENREPSARTQRLRELGYDRDPRREAARRRAERYRDLGRR